MDDKPDILSNLVSGLKGLFQPPAKPTTPTRKAPPKGADAFIRPATRDTAALAAQSTAPLEQVRTPEQKAEESKKRMVFIVKYMKDPASVPEFKDPKFVYKIITDERSYQTERVASLQAQLKQLIHGESDDPNAPSQLEQREDLERQIQASRDKLTQLFLLLKRVTGVKGKTGGTGFLPVDPDVLTNT